MHTAKFSLTDRDEALAGLAGKTDHTTVAVWAADCALRVLPYFAEAFPHDQRPARSIAVLRKWIQTGLFSMTAIRTASLDAHAAARAVGEDTSARSAARAVGQAVATAHVPTHALAAARYALQAIYRATDPSDADTAVVKERDWQYRQLLALGKT